MATETKRMTAEQLEQHLAHFTGDLERYRSISPMLIFTPGVKALADEGGRQGAYWLIDAIASYQATREINRSEDLRFMQFWTLRVDLEKRSAVLVCQADSGRSFVVEQAFKPSDFQLPEIKLYVQDNGDGTRTLMLPSEY